ncbi:MAG: hypothetical protein ACRDF0_02165 [Candidatus Limnocylindria bacterium]
MAPFERLAGEAFAYLTTIGRGSGKPHTIEIWFAPRHDALHAVRQR